MRTSVLSRFGLATVLLAAVVGCGGSDDENTASEPEGILEVFSWWTSGSEKAAFDALVDEFTNQYPKVEVINAAQDGSQAAHDLFNERMSGGDPPDTFQSNAASRLFAWVGTAGDQSQSKLLNLEPLAGNQGWKSSFSPEVRDLVTLGESMWAVPVNVHRINTVMYSPPMLAAAGIEAPPATLAELITACEKIDAMNQTCIGLGVKGGWTASLWIIDGLFPAVASADHSRAFLRGELSGDDPLFEETLHTAEALLDYSNADREALTWSEAALLVSAQQAAFNPMGDWAYAELVVQGAASGLLPQVDFAVIPHPGATGTYMMNFDVFSVTAGAKNQDAADAWLKAVGSEEGQTAFNLIKGSIPARSLSPENASRFDAYGQSAIQAFGASETQRVGALSTVLAESMEAEMNEVMGQFAKDSDVDAVLTWFKNNYWRFPNGG
jgi:glucose/mannose transport system substrate-binding protein